MTPEGLADELDADRDERIVAAGDWDDVETLWHATEAHAEAQRAKDVDQSVIVDDLGSLPVGLGFLADTHIGSKWVDMRALRHFGNEVGGWRERNPDALRLLFLGDGTDGYLPGMGRVSAGMLEETETDKGNQDDMFIWWAQSLGGINDITTGCHWLWTQKASGRNPLSWIAPKIGARDNGLGLFLTAHVGDQRYTIVARHKGKGLSALNTTNAHRTIYTQYEVPHGETADVIALAHLHVSNLQVQSYAGKRTVWLSAPGWKGGDCYARSIAAKHHADTGQGGMSVIVLDPRTHHVTAFDSQDWRLALQYLEYARRRAGAPL
jgi:hypothetical protein